MRIGTEGAAQKGETIPNELRPKLDTRSVGWREQSRDRPNGEAIQKNFWQENVGSKNPCRVSSSRALPGTSCCMAVSRANLARVFAHGHAGMREGHDLWSRAALRSHRSASACHTVTACGVKSGSTDDTSCAESKRSSILRSRSLPQEALR